MQTARPRPVTKYHRREEESLQIKVCNYLKRAYPHVIFVSDFAAGLNLTDTQRIKMVKMRSDDGQPDISIDYPSREYHGLRLELKKEGTAIYTKEGQLRKYPYTRRYRNGTIKRGDHLAEQAALLQRYNEMGYFARFVIGFDHAKAMIDWYFENEQQELF